MNSAPPPPTEAGSAPSPDPSSLAAALAKAAAALGIGQVQRHLFLCLGPECCNREVGERSWQYLKSRLSELKLVAPAGPVYRTKADCLRVCAAGPLAVVYPEGVWYERMTPERLDRVIEQHLIGGRIVEEFAFARNPLPGEPTPP